MSSAYCLLYKLFTLKLTRRQVQAMLDHVDSPYIRGLGFMYIRLVYHIKEWYIFSYFIPGIASLLRTCGTGSSPTWMTLRSVVPSSTSATVLQAVRMYRGRLL